MSEPPLNPPPNSGSLSSGPQGGRTGENDHETGASEIGASAVPRQRYGESIPRTAGEGERPIVRSPFSALPKSIPVARDRPWLQIALNLAIFAALPTALFWHWYLTDVRPALTSDLSGLRWAMPLAALWITIGPLLMQLGEFLEDRWLDLVEGDSEVGWNLWAIHQRRAQLGRLYYWIVPFGALTAVASLALALPALREVLPSIDGWGLVAAFVVIAQVGFTSTSGALGAVKAITVPGVAVRGAELGWRPFGGQFTSVKSSFRFFAIWGVMFSVGAVFVPALIIVEGTFADPARVIVWAFIAVLILNGTAIFLVPTLRLYAALNRAKSSVLERLGGTLGDLMEDMIGSLNLSRSSEAARQELYSLQRAMSVLLTLRRDVASVHVAPSGRTVLNAVLTVILPTVSVALSIFEAGSWVGL